MSIMIFALSACGVGKPKIEDYEWKMRTIMHAEDNQVIYDAVAEESSTHPEAKIIEIIKKCFDLRPAGIIKMLDLRRPIYKQTAAYGHFGRNDLDLPWEKLDKIDILKTFL